MSVLSSTFNDCNEDTRLFDSVMIDAVLIDYVTNGDAPFVRFRLYVAVCSSIQNVRRASFAHHLSLVFWNSTLSPQRLFRPSANTAGVYDPSSWQLDIDAMMDWLIWEVLLWYFFSPLLHIGHELFTKWIVYILCLQCLHFIIFIQKKKWYLLAFHNIMTNAFKTVLYDRLQIGWLKVSPQFFSDLLYHIQCCW